MNDKDLVDVAEAMVAEGKGILAIDESAAANPPENTARALRSFESSSHSSRMRLSADRARSISALMKAPCTNTPPPNPSRAVDRRRARARPSGTSQAWCVVW